MAHPASNKNAPIPPFDPQQTAANEPPYRTKAIDILNSQAADRKQSIILRLPQPNDQGHCCFISYKWSDEDFKQYKATKILPRDHTTVDKDAKLVQMWIFSAKVGKEIGEVETESVPDFEKAPAMMCFIDEDDGGKTYLIPSEDLEVVKDWGEEGEVRAWGTSWDYAIVCGPLGMGGDSRIEACKQGKKDVGWKWTATCRHVVLTGKSCPLSP